MFNITSFDKMSFKNKVVIVTGAGSGIGAAIVELFTREDALVTAVDKNADGLHRVAKQCNQNGIAILQIAADVTNEEDANRIIKETIDKHGKLDVLVNAAGIIKGGSILDGTIMKTFDELINVNLRAIVQLTTLAAPYLVKTKGNIVNISSNGDRQCPVPFAAYCVSKAGVTHFTKGAAFELGPSGVRVNSISPGTTRTRLLDDLGLNDFEQHAKVSLLGKVAEPEEIADLVAYLASDKARSITGANYVIDNGYTVKGSS